MPIATRFRTFWPTICRTGSRSLALWWFAFCWGAEPSLMCAAGDDLAGPISVAEARSRHGQALKSLYDELSQAGQTRAAKTVRSHWIARDRHRQYAFWPERKSRLPATAGAATDLGPWQERWEELRSEQADRLFSLARATVDSHPAEAYRLLHEALYEYPEHRGAREVLDLPSKAPRTGTIRTRRPTQPQPWFGWSPRSYYLVESPHFVIVSHLRGSAPRELAERLELLEQVWRQVFFDYWSDGRWLRDRFRGRATPAPRFGRFQVVLFRDREDYVTSLADVEPQIRESLGYYVPRRKTSFFYSDKQRPWATWFHEVTHQLFQESVGGVADPGERSHIWAVEGLALYMESLRLFEGYATVGGFDAARLQFARYRRLRANYFVPLPDLVKLGREAFQEREDVRRLYSQCAGLAHYFMDGEEGSLRPAFLRYANQVYQGRDDAEMLRKTLSRSPDELADGYVRFLQIDDSQLPFIGPSPLVKQLSLGGTRVTARGIRYLESLRDLEWLDLAGLPLTSADLTWIGKNRQLTQLMLERTQVDDEMVTALKPLRSLVELDLSGTAVGDPTAAAISSLTNLQALWLSDTQLTDAGLARLARLKKLTVLDVSGTRVTLAGIRKLQRLLPKLEKIDGP